MKKYFELTEEGKEKLSKLPMALKYMANYLMDGLDSLIGGNCNEETVASTIGTLKNNAEGRITDADTMNYDEAGEALGFGATNRNGLKSLLDKNNIHQVKINNMPCGFRRDEIMALRDKLNKDIRRREIKRKTRTTKFLI